MKTLYESITQLSRCEIDESILDTDAEATNKIIHTREMMIIELANAFTEFFKDLLEIDTIFGHNGRYDYVYFDLSKKLLKRFEKENSFDVVGQLNDDFSEFLDKKLSKDTTISIITRVNTSGTYIKNTIKLTHYPNRVYFDNGISGLNQTYDYTWTVDVGTNNDNKLFYETIKNKK